MSLKAKYEHLCQEAKKEGWRIGSYQNAAEWFRERVTPQLLALRDGGVRALDNTLPPILRNHNDLWPFEFVCGDQHRWDFWVFDPETGEIFRPEGYLLQDLLTRNIYGGAVAKRYSAQLIVLAMRTGLHAFGCLFQNLYTDWGKPETGSLVATIMARLKSYGIGACEAIDAPVEFSGADGEEVACYVDLPGQHRKAVVRNAKAKMIESTNKTLEQILVDHCRLPGYAKRLSDSKEYQEVDEAEARKLAETGKLPTFREFVAAFYKALTFYNRERPHRGVLREWKWEPKPKEARPLDCLNMCIRDDWRPTRLSPEAADIFFLPETTRVVDRGRVAVNKILYEHEDLVPLNGKKVACRFDPLDPGWVLVFRQGNELLCRAEPVEYSSMKDRELAARKIREKARLRKGVIEEYRMLTSGIPDIRHFSEIPAAEKVAALVGQDKRRKAAENEELYRVRTPEELEAEAAPLRSYEHKEVKPARPKRLCFATPVDRISYLLDSIADGEELPAESLQFLRDQLAGFDEDTRNYWYTSARCLGIECQLRAALEPALGEEVNP